jgi:D-alanyl-D-alanine carboxypeptidase
VAAYQPAVTQAPITQAAVQAPVSVAVLTPPAPPPTPAPRPVFQVAPAYQPSYGKTSAPSQSAANPPAARLAAYAPPIRRTYAVPHTVGPYGTQNLASEMNEPAYTPRSGGGLHLIAPAMADTIPLTLSVGGAGSWAIQVGAYGSAGDAREAVQSARQHERYQLASARTIVMPVHVSQKLLYRARLGGLSEGAAVNACNVISRHSPCMVISPDAQ